jgi:hypothetical protein
VDRRGELDVVADDDVIRHLLEDLVEVTGGSEQASLRQAVEDVLLRLRDPLTLGLQWTHVLCVGALIGDVVDLD